MTPQKLLNCPFCGAKAVFELIEGSCYVICKECMACTNHYGKDIEAFEAWNTRSPGLDREKLVKLILKKAADIPKPIVGECILTHWKCSPNDLVNAIIEAERGLR